MATATSALTSSTPISTATPVPEKPSKTAFGKSSAKPQKWVFQWTTASIVTALTLVVFAADFFFLEMNSEPRVSWFGVGTLAQLWNFVRSSKLFAMDCVMCVSLLALMVKFGFRFPGMGGKPKVVKQMPSNRNSKRRQEEAGARTGLATNAGTDASAARPTPVDRPVSRWNSAIDLAARQGDSKKAGQLLLEFEQQGNDQPGNKPDIVSYNLVIRACAKKGDYKGAEEWLSRMEASGLEATVCSYNTVLDSCAKADNAEACESWLKTMLSKGIEANVISYATAIYARARRGETDLAEVWLKRMTDAGITPDAVCYNSMIHACGVGGNIAGAERWIEEMQAAGLEASVTTFTAVVDACAKAADVPRAEKWLEAMIAANIEPNVVSFSAMIDACAKTSDPVRAEYWHDRMVQCNVKPNAHSYSAVINACAKAGDVDRAEEWLGRSEKAGVANDVVIYSSVIDACGKVGDADRAMVVFERMQAHGLKPHIVAYAALARPFAYRGDWMVVERIAGEMAAAHIYPNEYFLYAQLLSYATVRPRQAERAEKCFREALRVGLKANDHVVGALARAVGRDRCTELMAELCNGRPVPLPPASRRQGGGNNSNYRAKPGRQ